MGEGRLESDLSKGVRPDRNKLSGGKWGEPTMSVSWSKGRGDGERKQ